MTLPPDPGGAVLPARRRRDLHDRRVADSMGETWPLWAGYSMVWPLRGEHPVPPAMQQLVGRCLRGDQFAIRELVDQFRGQVYGLCVRMLGHCQDAEDMTQETFVRALRGLHGWDARREFAPWLMAIAGNRCRTLLATRSRRPATSDALESIADQRPCEESFYNLHEEVQLALAGLRVEYQQAFRLFHEREMSYEEIAFTLNCPIGTVKTWVHRARRELIARLSEREVVGELADEMHRVSHSA